MKKVSEIVQPTSKTIRRLATECSRSTNEYSPMPVPWDSMSKLSWNFTNNRPRFSFGTPGPESSTKTCTLCRLLAPLDTSPSCSSTTLAPSRMYPSSTNLLELIARFNITCLRRRRSDWMTRFEGQSIKTLTLLPRRNNMAATGYTNEERKEEWEEISCLLFIPTLPLWTEKRYSLEVHLLEYLWEIVQSSFAYSLHGSSVICR